MKQLWSKGSEQNFGSIGHGSENRLRASISSRLCDLCIPLCCATSSLKTRKHEVIECEESTIDVKIFVCYMVVIGIAITSLALGYRIPVIVSGRTDGSVDDDRKVARNNTHASSKCTCKTDLGVVNASTNDISMERNMKLHVAFLKVHKAGSTTMQNLFFRFGLRHKLNILLPTSGNSVSPKSKKIPIKSGQHYDIFACHTVYSKKWFDSLLPADSVNIGIVREPISRMISAAYYYRDVWRVEYLKKVPPANFIQNLVNFPEKYDTSFFSHTKNTMGKDFGFKRVINPDNTVRIRKYLDYLNTQFLLVLVMEKFDESLVLMKRLLNWSLVDILYLKTNSHVHKPIVLNKTETDKFRRTSFLDFEIYEYFAKVFEMKLQQANNSFSDEVNFFKTVLNRVSEFCSKVNKASDTILVIQSSKWDEEFKVLNTECKWMQTKELMFINKLRKMRLYTQS